MGIGFFTHSDMLDHRPGPGHPESPARLQAVVEALEDASDLDLEPFEASQAEIADLALVHPLSYIEELIDFAPVAGLLHLDGDTPISPGSILAARRAAGAVLDAVRAVASGRLDRAFCAIRPPGHHAEPDRGMGFCLFSNVAIGARAAQEAGLSKVAVVDFDVHHGNGTQAVVAADRDLMFASIHQYPFYPGTGAAAERGVGNLFNEPVPAMAPRETWRAGFSRLMQALDAFGPDLVLISAGFDAHARDPLAQQQLEAEDFAWATSAVLEVARLHAKGRVVSSLEGGYDLQALGRSAAAHVRALQAV